MSEHRRKPPQPEPQGGSRAATRRAAQQRPGRGAPGAGRDVPTASPSVPYGEPASTAPMPVDPPSGGPAPVAAVRRAGVRGARTSG